MDFLKQLLAQTQGQLRGLGASQRLAIGLCAVLILVSLGWLVSWAGRPVLVPLLEQPMTAQELAPIQQRLDAQSIIYKVTGSMILVPAESRPRLLAQLGQQHALPNDISIGFAKLMEENSPWLSMEEQSRRWGVARSYELSRVLREFEGVADARVLIDEKTRRIIGGPPVTPTASIFVKMQPGAALDRDRAFAMASFVSRAVAGLDIASVAVTDATSGRSYTLPNAERGMAFDDLEDRQRKEEYFANKIKSLLANIPGLLVAVHAELDTEARHETKQTYGRPVQLTDKTERSTQERGTSATGPGAVSDASQSVTPVPITERAQKNTSEATFDGKVDVTQVTIESPRHGLRSLSASVNVPRSYLAAIFQQANSGKEPTDAELEQASVPWRDKIKRQVERALSIPKDSDAVVVDWFHDEGRMRTVEAMEAAPADGVVALARAYGGKAGVAALGAMSLLMMLMVVRRAGSGPALPGGYPVGERGACRGGRRRQGASITIAPRIGGAEVSDRLSVAKEVHERAVRTRQVIEQVNGLVRDDPRSSVGILKRWIESGEN